MHEINNQMYTELLVINKERMGLARGWRIYIDKPQNESD